MSTQITVLSRNLYLGAPTERLFGGTCADLPHNTRGFFDAIDGTDYPARAEAMASEIAIRSPHLVGLQEVFDYRSWPALPRGDERSPRPEIEIDFLALLGRALAALGARYDVVCRSLNTFEVLPIARASGEPGQVSIADYDVILARSDVWTRGAVTANFTRRQTIPIPAPGCGREVELVQGYGWVDARIGDRELRFVNTHLADSHTGHGPSQARELLAALDAAEPALPIVLVGDLNSDPAQLERRAAYEVIAGAEFRDAQLDVGSAVQTCCEDPDLSNPESNLARDDPAISMRIDFVLWRGPFETLSFERFGCTPSERVAGRSRSGASTTLWPSDHAGIASTLNLEWTEDRQ